MGGSSRGNQSNPPPPPPPPEAQGVSGMGVEDMGTGGVYGRRAEANLMSRRRGRAANILTMMGGAPATTGGTGTRTLLGGSGGGTNA